MKLQIAPNDFPRFLARGNVKECYVGDKWHDRVLKVSPVGKSRLTPLEIDYFERLERRGITADFLPKYYGWFENERWVGYVQEFIRGETIMTLTDYLRAHIAEPDVLRDLEAQLSKLYEEILASGVLVLNLHTENILVDTATMRFWVIDGFGTPEKFPLPYWFDFCRRRKLKKHWEKIKRRYRNTVAELNAEAAREDADVA